ncbi:MAG: HPr family phosphocarrier protein [Gammaproteobacteria bacterium]|nr:HPr family phosphocarrier protein [Gammaproteobacteria bacterium]MCZ6852529.1 HPr family phosphocarrier protein [Gammaproteobacteria bacterium]
MLETTLTIVNRLGLHARAAGKFVNLSKTFSSEIYLTRGGEAVDGKSIMSVMLLAAPVGSKIDLKVVGVDEEQAFAELKELVDDGFGERDD